MELIVRNARLEDVYLIHQINQKAFSAFQSFYPNGIVPALTELPQNIVEDIRGKTVLIAQYGDQIVGSIRLHFINNNIAYISRFSILHLYQKLGIGTKLLNAVVEKTKEKNGRFLTLNAHYGIKPVLQFYLKNGFMIKKISYDKCYPRAYLFRKVVEGGVNYEAMEWQVF
ncbi:MAG: GNAT family N-acetyltransferase [Halanaerobiales bacterium]|nr:GNAT family N-acetyltransferase [Halanaerobiales bacterium]